MKPNRDADNLLDIMQAIADLDEIARYGHAEFMRSRILQAAALYRFHIIAEAARRLSPELTARYPKVVWKEIRGFRNLLTHDYDEVDFTTVAFTLANDIPALKLDIQGILKDLNDGG